MPKGKNPKKPPALVRSSRSPVAAPANRLLGDLRGLIEQAREHVARAVNAGLVGLYWQVGRRIQQDILHEQRAEYGEEIVYALSRQLTAEFGRGFGHRSLFRMVQFAEMYPAERIVSALSAQLGWSYCCIQV